MKQLTLSQAARCENADPSTPCRCRCRGVLHGAARITDADERAFAALPEDDPHHHDADQNEKSLPRRGRSRIVICGKCLGCRQGQPCMDPIDVRYP